MENFVNDFYIFFSSIFECAKNFYDWFISTTFGEIFIFLILISLFFFLINLFVDFKD